MPLGRDMTSLPSLRRTAPKKLMLLRVGAWRQTGSSTSGGIHMRSEEHTSELQSRQYLVCRLLLEKKTCSLARTGGDGTVRPMRELLILAIHLLVAFAKLLRPGGLRALSAESLLLKHQLLISTRY